MTIATRTGVVAVAALSLVLAACTPTNEREDWVGGSDLTGELNGAGASSQESAMEAWRAAFQTDNRATTVNYDAVGSGGGRTQFLDGATSFAGSDSLMNAGEYALAVERCDGTAGAIHFPTYVSPIAVIFNLDGVASLNMTSDVIAQIFDGKIANWSDAAIADINPGVSLPDLVITSVHRSDESGTSKNFTDYLAKASESWPYEPSGEWPNNIGEGGPGTSAVVSLVRDTNGTIAYADASRVGTLGTVALGVGDSFVEFSPAGAAIAVAASPLAEGANGANDLAYELDRNTTAEGAYPLVLVSYHVACQQYDDVDERALVTAFLRFVASEDGQDVSARAAGSSPIGSLGDDVVAILDEIAVG